MSSEDHLPLPPEFIPPQMNLFDSQISIIPTPTAHSSVPVSTNRKMDQLEVGIYFLKSELQEFEKAANAKSAWLGWFGMAASSAAAWYATKPTDVLWISIWAGLIALGLFQWIRHGWIAFCLRKLDVNEFIRRIKEEDH